MADPNDEPFWNKRDRMVCATCFYSVVKSTHIHNGVVLTMGRCRRRAPEVEKGWPAVVLEKDWCGEYKLDGTKMKPGDV